MAGMGGRVLLVDDDLFFAARILSVLEKHGYRAERAATADQAVQTVRDGCPELIILNLGSSKLPGTELARRLKTEAGKTPLVAFVSHTKIPGLRAEAEAAGVDRLVPNSAITMRLPLIVERALVAGRGMVVEDEEDAA